MLASRLTRLAAVTKSRACTFTALARMPQQSLPKAQPFPIRSLFGSAPHDVHAHEVQRIYLRARAEGRPFTPEEKVIQAAYRASLRQARDTPTSCKSTPLAKSTPLRQRRLRLAVYRDDSFSSLGAFDKVFLGAMFLFFGVPVLIVRYGPIFAAMHEFFSQWSQDK